MLKHKSEIDREEREGREIIESTSLATIVKGAVWVGGNWMLEATANVITNTAIAAVGVFNKQTNKHVTLSDPDMETLDDDISPVAPPTDSELAQKGLGFMSDSDKFSRSSSGQDLLVVNSSGGIIIKPPSNTEVRHDSQMSPMLETLNHHCCFSNNEFNKIAFLFFL